MVRRLAAIMAGDIVGYSRLMAEDEAGTYESLRALMEEVVRPVIQAGSGTIFKTTGDGFLAAFASVGEALDAGLVIQRGMADSTMQLRLGLNLGDVIDDGEDVFGDGVNVAARLESMAEPGTIYVSVAVVRAAGRKPGIRFERIGNRRGKNLPDAIDTYIVRPGRGARALPPAVTRARALTAGGVALGALAIGVGVIDGRPVAMLRETIQAVTGVAEAEAASPSVAVLPFDNLGGDGEDYFADGLTEDIINDLARSRELLVIARNSTFAYKDVSTDIRTIGNQLGANYIVEGSTRRAGDQLRVVAQLIDANTGVHLWSKSYDRQMADVFALQDDLTSEITASLVSYVGQTEETAAASRPTEDVRAYDLVLQGRDRFAHGSSDPAALFDARDRFARAVTLDPGYAVARAELGKTYIADQMQGITGDATSEDLERGMAHLREAIRLEPELALAFQFLSYGLSGLGDYQGAMRAARRAIELNPSDPDSQMSLAKAQLRFGDYETAVDHAERARRLNPLAPQYYPFIHAQALYATEQFEEGNRVLGDCLLRVPNDKGCILIRAAVQTKLDRPEAARASIARLIEIDPNFSLAEERNYRRFGDAPLMDVFLADLKAAGAPETAGQV